MARQRRVAISVPAETHWRLRKLVEKGVGDNDSALVGEMINVLADQHGIPTISRDEALAERARQRFERETPAREHIEIASQYFTF